MSQENMSQTQNQEQQDQLREIVEKITKKVEEFGKAIPSIDKEVDELIRKWKNVRECLTHYCRLELSVFSATLYARLDGPVQIEVATGVTATVNDIVKMIRNEIYNKFDQMLTETIHKILNVLSNELKQ